MHPPLRQQISDLVTSLLSIPSISANLTSTSITDLKAFIRISRVLFRPFTWKAELLNANIVGRQYDQRRKLQEALDQEEWYATAEDAQRIWTNVIRHRIDVQGSRDGNFRFLERTVLDDGSTSASNKATLGGAKPIERGIAAQNIEDAVAGILQDITRRCAN